jgi:hypothetical protein
MYREYNGNTHYLSQDSVPVHFGLGQADTVQRLELAWPSGEIQYIDNIASNQMFTVVEGRSIVRGRPRVRAESGYVIFVTGSSWLIQWLGGEDLRHTFSGTITTDGTFSFVESFSFEPNDTLAWGTKQIDFNGNSKLYPDTIRFTADGATTVTFDIQQDGISQPENIFIGEYGVKPAAVPLVLTP